MRASRLVSVLLLLQARGQLTAGELARELEVSERTIHRDVEALSASGVPIYAERGVARRDPPGRRLPHAADRDDRRRGRGALPGRACPGPPPSSAWGRSWPAAQLKVLASLPPELRARASRLVERFHLDAGEWFRTEPAGPPPRRPVRRGLERDADRHRLRPRRRARRAIARAARPRPQGRHLVRRRRASTARSARIASRGSSRPSRPSERFERPDGFDLAGYWAESAEAYERDVAAHRGRRAGPPRPARPPPRRGRQRASSTTAEYLGDPDPDGWLRLRLRLDWPDEAPRTTAPRRSLGRGPRARPRSGPGSPPRPARSPSDTPAIPA